MQGLSPLYGRRSQSGASLIIGLVVFLVCAMVSAVIVGYASANVERVKGRVEAEADYQALVSALRLAVGNDQLSQEFWIKRIPAHDVAVGVDTETGETLYQHIPEAIIPGWNTQEKGEVGAWLRYSAQTKGMGEYTHSDYTLQEGVFDITVGEASVELPDATVTYKLNNSYGIEVAVRLKDAQGAHYADTLSSTISPEVKQYYTPEAGLQVEMFVVSWKPLEMGGAR